MRLVKTETKTQVP